MIEIGPTDDAAVWAWWAFMTTAALTNAALWLRSRGSKYTADDRPESAKDLAYRSTMTACSFMYAFACGTRSVWLRKDVERVCFFAAAVNWPVVGRSLATAAEIAFSWQLAAGVRRLADDCRAFRESKALYGFTRAVTAVTVPAITFAQCCCWQGVVTTQNLAHAVEETIWAVVVALLTVCCIGLALHLPKDAPKGTTARAEAKMLSDARLFTRVFVAGGVCYVAFMVTVDVPMYIARAAASTKPILGWADGLAELSSCVTYDRTLDTWAHDIPWMSGYFTLAVWLSIWLGRGPRLANDTGAGGEKRD